jgi:hypothetical protein
MTFSEIKTRHAELQVQIDQWKALHTQTQHELERFRCERLEELPVEVRSPLLAAAESLRPQSLLVVEQKELWREIESQAVVLELRRLYSLPDSRSEWIH